MTKRRNHLGRFGQVALAISLFLILTNQSALADFTYFNDFEGNPATWTEWADWNPGPGSIVKATSPSGQNFLGSNHELGFYNETAELTLPDFPAGSRVDLKFQLYTIQTWDGSNHVAGPDFWELYVGGRVLLFTTFGSSPSVPQAYPDNYPTAPWHPGTTGSSAIGSLGYYNNVWGDVTYDIEKNFVHNGGALWIDFTAYHLEGGIYDESWGLDNVQVLVETPINTPIPDTLILFGSGLLFFAGLMKRGK